MDLVKVHLTDSVGRSMLILNVRHLFLQLQKVLQLGVWKIMIWLLSEGKFKHSFLNMSIGVMWLLNTTNNQLGQIHFFPINKWPNWICVNVEIKVFPNGVSAKCFDGMLHSNETQLRFPRYVSFFQTEKNQAKRLLLGAQTLTRKGYDIITTEEVKTPHNANNAPLASQACQQFFSPKKHQKI